MSLESGPKKAMFGSDIYASDKIATPYEIILGSQRPAISLKNAVESIQEYMTQDDFMYANCELQYTLYLINLNTGEREVLYETQPKRGMCFGEYSKIRWL